MDYIVPQAPLSMEFSRQEYWSGLPFSPAGDLLNPGIEPGSLSPPALADGFFAPSVAWLKGQWDSPSSLTPERAAHGLCCTPVQHPAALLAPKPAPRGTSSFRWGCLFLKIKGQDNPAWWRRTDVGVVSKLNIFQQNVTKIRGISTRHVASWGLEDVLCQTISTSSRAPYLWHLPLRRQEVRLTSSVGLAVQGSEVNVVAPSFLHLRRGRASAKNHETDPVHLLQLDAVYLYLWPSSVAQRQTNPPANAGDVGLIPRLGGCPGERNGNPLQYSGLENPMDRGAWRTTVSQTRDPSQTWLSDMHTSSLHYLFLGDGCIHFAWLLHLCLRPGETRHGQQTAHTDKQAKCWPISVSLRLFISS